MLWTASGVLATCLLVIPPSALAALRDEREHGCQHASVLILGAGVAGVTAAKTLANRGIDDFLIVEYNDHIGGRVLHTEFGAKSDGTPYTVELGANWVQGTETKGGPENPIWTLAKKYKLANTFSNYSSILTYNETGTSDYRHLLGEYSEAYRQLEQDAGYILTENLQDRSARAGLQIAGWNSKKSPAMQAVDWWEWDFEYAYPPEESSQEFAIVNYNTTFYQYSNRNNYVYDQRGFNTFIQGEANSFLSQDPPDPRLLLNTIVTNITYSPHNVTIHTSCGRCFTAQQAICTFSLGVLTNSPTLSFHPPLPPWKLQSLATFDMATYTKIFLQFPHGTQFWPRDTQFFLYADPVVRGYYPLFQSLSAPGFLGLDAAILFVTVTGPESQRVEQQSDARTKAEVLAVLRRMFPHATIPEPIAFLYPRWGRTPWAYGSYSNWPPGTSLAQHQNLRANLGALRFAGEATSSEYYGFLQGAWFEGRAAGAAVARCLLGQGGLECVDEARYAVLHGTTPLNEYNASNGWDVSSFETFGFRSGD